MYHRAAADGRWTVYPPGDVDDAYGWMGLFEDIATVRCALVDPGADGPTPLAALAARLYAPDVLGTPLAELGLALAGLERLLASQKRME